MYISGADTSSQYLYQIAKQNVMKNDAIFAKNNGQEKGVDDHDRTSLIHFCANEQIQKTTTMKKKKEEARWWVSFTPFGITFCLPVQF